MPQSGTPTRPVEQLLSLFGSESPEQLRAAAYELRARWLSRGDALQLLVAMLDEATLIEHFDAIGQRDRIVAASAAALRDFSEACRPGTPVGGRRLLEAAEPAWAGTARSALSCLRRCLRNSSTLQHALASSVLVAMRERGVPLLIEVLEDENRDVRCLAAYSLSQIGPSACAAMAALLGATRDSDAAVRVAAAHALRVLPIAADAAGTLVGIALSDPDRLVRFAAPAAEWPPPRAVESEPASSSRDHSHVGGAILAFRGGSGRTVAQLILALGAADPRVRYAATAELATLGPGAREAIPELLLALDDRSAPVRRGAAYAMGELALASQRVVPRLLQALDDADEIVQLRATRALQAFAGGASAAAPRLIRALEEPGAQLVQAAIAALASIGDAAVGPLAGALHHQSARVRRHAVEALAVSQASADRVASALVPALVEEELRELVAASLQRLGPGVRDLIPPRWQGLVSKPRYGPESLS